MMIIYSKPLSFILYVRKKANYISITVFITDHSTNYIQYSSHFCFLLPMIIAMMIKLMITLYSEYNVFCILQGENTADFYTIHILKRKANKASKTGVICFLTPY